LSPLAPNGNITHYIVFWRQLPQRPFDNTQDTCSNEFQRAERNLPSAHVDLRTPMIGNRSHVDDTTVNQNKATCMSPVATTLAYDKFIGFQVLIFD
jgi:hypothetical protein